MTDYLSPTVSVPPNSAPTGDTHCDTDEAVAGPDREKDMKTKPAPLPHPVYGWDSVQLYRNLSLAQLNELRLAVEADPVHQNPRHTSGDSIYLYTKAAIRKLDAISWAITYHLQDLKGK